MKKENEFKNFENAMRKIITVSHDELEKREKKYQKNMEKKRAKNEPASREAV